MFKWKNKKNDNKKYVANYFFIAEKLISKYKPDSIVTMQFFQRKENAILCGINEALDFLKKNTDTKKYKIKYLPEGSKIKSLEPVLELEGHYKDFGIFEGVIDGILARSTSIATNAWECIQAAKGKEIIYMGDRADHYINQEIDGHAVEVAGLKKHSTMAGSRMNEDVIFGSIPHVLIQQFDGNLVEAMKAYKETFPNEKELIALVDFSNDVIKDSLSVLKVFKEKLYGVRVDTSKNMIDHMFDNDENRSKYNGVNPEQIKRLRKALDENNGKHVKIIVSSGFNPEKISLFEKENTPVDVYGVGDFILKINIGFTCDAVKNNGKEIAKEGRKYSYNSKLLSFN
ncbi:MAG: nicotinate phosphoribosyltransferase [Mycoplasmataceae bacterium]|nr:nicotinate phosphoribosyltransferase [Mycoplasmataceae bacterium]MBR3571613.1 nicotinate phosphoribosyltransferase [Mycoplasmataceae bacterium]